MRTYIEQPATRALRPTGGFLRGVAYSLNPPTVSSTLASL